MKNMAKPCAPPSEYGAQSIAALRQCKKNPNLASWPSEQTSSQSCTEGNKSTKPIYARGTLRKGVALSLPRPVPMVCTTPPLSASASPPAPLPNPPCDASSDITLPEYYQTLKDLLELEEAGEPVVWPDGLTAGSAKCAISQKEEEMKAAYSVAQPSFPLANKLCS